MEQGAVLIDGKQVSAKIREVLKQEVTALSAKGISPGLAVVIVGDDSASHVYVNNKKKACGELGMYSEQYTLPESTTQAELLKLVEQLNHKDTIHGILIQLPLPKHIHAQTILEAISPAKDVDAFHPANVGQIVLGNQRFVPCTPAGVMALLEAYHIDVEGKHCVIMGRSNIVGKPMALLLLQANGTVTITHSKTPDIKTLTKQADILIVAIGKAKYVTADMVKAGAVVIDVGMDRDEQGKLCGDVDFVEVRKIASYITPVPGGVGPMTITMLMKNTIAAANQ